MTAWWQKFPSLTPVKGFARFLYILTHYESISEELKKRDERPKAVEEAVRQLLVLERERHEAEKAKLSREFEDKLAAIAEHGDHLLDQARAQLEELRAPALRLVDAHTAALRALTVVLFVEENPVIRDRVLAMLPPEAREFVSQRIQRFRELEEKGEL